MKPLFVLTSLLFILTQSSAQIYVPVDSARKLARSENPEKKFRGFRALDRFYYTTGMFDSSSMLQKEMFAIAKDLKRDSMMMIVYRAIGNRYIIKTDYNFGLISYSKALEHAETDAQRASLYGNLAYVYIVTENNEVALSYLEKMKQVNQQGQDLYFRNLLYGIVYNNLGKPDSALFYFRRAEDVPARMTDALMISVFFLQMGRAYELRGDADLADTWYKKTLAFCKEKKLVSSLIKHGNIYCDFLLKSGKYDEARMLALENFSIAQKSGINEGISNVASTLRKIYSHYGTKDSIIFYSQLQIDFKDSVNNQKKAAEFQNLTFAQQLREIDEQTKAKEASLERKQNIQYALIALGILLLIILYLLLSRSFLTNTKWIGFFGVIALLIVFEFLNLLFHPFIERITHHSPVLMLLALVGIAALLVPLHHWLEKWAIHKLVEKNKKIRLEVARKTIQQLENDKTLAEI
jgi:tetratricopeptide (TPR) repeat protein